MFSKDCAVEDRGLIVDIGDALAKCLLISALIAQTANGTTEPVVGASSPVRIFIRGRFATAIRPSETDELPRSDIEIDIVKDGAPPLSYFDRDIFEPDGAIRFRRQRLLGSDFLQLEQVLDLIVIVFQALHVGQLIDGPQKGLDELTGQEACLRPHRRH